MVARFAGEVGEVDVEVAAELPEDLTARAARRRLPLGISDDRDAREDVVALGERLEHRDALRADRQTVGRVLDVAASEDGAVAGLERGADLEPRVRRVRVLARSARRGDNVDFARLAAQPPRTDAAVHRRAAVAFRPSDVAYAAVEAGAAVGLDRQR